VPSAARLLSDQNGDTWLTWWEGPNPAMTSPPNLYAIPLTDGGTPAGPVESWFASNQAIGMSAGFNLPPTVSPPGPLGIVYPVTVDVPTDASPGGLEEIHLVHRQLGVVAPLEDIVFTRAPTGFPVVAVQTAQPRGLVVGYSTYDATGGAQAQLVRYSCAEDANGG
jgi:hypothetical protein